MRAQSNTALYAAYAVFNVMVAKEVNDLVQQPYMVSALKDVDVALPGRCNRMSLFI